MTDRFTTSLGDVKHGAMVKRRGYPYARRVLNATMASTWSIAGVAAGIAVVKERVDWTLDWWPANTLVEIVEEP